MDLELRNFLEGMEGRIVQRIDGRLDAVEERMQRMDGRIDAVEERIMQRVEGRLEALEERIMQRIDGRIDAVEERMKAHTNKSCDEVVTKLLGEFWKWGRTSDARTRQALDNVAAVNERLLAVEDRVTALERRGGHNNA
jgi:hypothetical protein